MKINTIYFLNPLLLILIGCGFNELATELPGEYVERIDGVHRYIYNHNSLLKRVVGANVKNIQYNDFFIIAKQETEKKMVSK